MPGWFSDSLWFSDSPLIITHYPTLHPAGFDIRGLDPSCKYARLLRTECYLNLMWDIIVKPHYR